VKTPISAMSVRVPEKDRWCGTRGKFMRLKGVRVTKASKHAKMGVRVMPINSNVMNINDVNSNVVNSNVDEQSR
ncbi:hypothetical protein Tco_0459497, partial [Tanacetum coccineum]